MKNKLKKSKIIVPALALITATTVASVTGTVAWFTANRAVTVSAGNFIATKVESNLKVETAAGLGTAATTGNTGITTMTGNNSDTTNKLTHGSYDAQMNAQGSLYVAKVSDDGKQYEAFTNLKKLSETKVENPTTSSCSWLARTDATNKINIWYGLSWTMKFSLETASTNTSDYLFIDVKSSKFTNNDSSSGTTTAPGFRIAFMTKDTFVVLGGDDTVTHVGSSTQAQYEYKSASAYVEGTTYYTQDSEGSYTKATGVTSDNLSNGIYYTYEWKYSYESYTKDTNYFVVGQDITKATDVKTASESTLKDNKLNLGSIGVASDEDNDESLTITCVAWYEGSDANVADTLNNTTIDMSSITADLEFYTRGVIA